MRFKIPLKWTLLIAGIAGVAVFLIIVFFSAPNLFGKGEFTKLSPLIPAVGQVLSAAIRAPVGSNLSESASAGDVLPEQASSNANQAPVLPFRLKIPKINVDAAVESVGLTSQGDLGVPKGLVNVAWYNRGPRPGETGNAVIDGHFGWQNGQAAVFDNLHKLEVGDKIYIDDGKGKAMIFAVREIRKYDAAADAVDVFSSNDGKAHLNLITCNGEWNKIDKIYSDRLVVFADKEN